MFDPRICSGFVTETDLAKVYTGKTIKQRWAKVEEERRILDGPTDGCWDCGVKLELHVDVSWCGKWVSSYGSRLVCKACFTQKCYLCKAPATEIKHDDGRFRCEACARLNVPITELPGLKAKMLQGSAGGQEVYGSNADQKTLRHGDVVRCKNGQDVVISRDGFHNELCRLAGSINPDIAEDEMWMYLHSFDGWMMRDRSYSDWDIVAILGNVTEEAK